MASVASVKQTSPITHVPSNSSSSSSTPTSSPPISLIPPPSRPKRKETEKAQSSQRINKLPIKSMMKNKQEKGNPKKAPKKQEESFKEETRTKNIENSRG